jgi:hypothetical protein
MRCFKGSKNKLGCRRPAISLFWAGVFGRTFMARFAPTTFVIAVVVGALAAAVIL